MPLIGSVLNYQVDSGSVLLAGAIQVRRLQRAAQDTGLSGHGPLSKIARQVIARVTGWLEATQGKSRGNENVGFFGGDE